MTYLYILLSINTFSLIGIILFCGAFILLGRFLYKSANKEQKRYNSSMGWVKIKATLLRKEFVTNRPNSADLPVTFETKAEYSYCWNNKVYTNNEIAFGYGGSSSKRFNEWIYDKILQAEEIEIWLNPKNPEESVICRVIASSIPFYKSVGLFFIIIAVTILLAFLLNLEGNYNILDHLQIIK